MDKMLLAVFNTEPGAYEGLSALKDLHKDGDITLRATAVIVKDSPRILSIIQASDEGPAGTGPGMLTGSLLGFLARPLGVGAGTPAGGQAGIGVDFADEVSKALIPGKAAVLAEVQEAWVTPVDMKPGKLGGLVFRRQRSQAEDQLARRESVGFDGELKQLKEELARASAKKKAAVQNRIADVRHKLEVIGAQARRGRRNPGARAGTRCGPMNRANDRQKARIGEHSQ